MKKTKYQGLSTLEVLEGADNYNKWIAETIRLYTKSPLLELGAGTGNISDHFLDKKNVWISEYDKGLVSYLQGKYQVKKNTRVLHLDVTKKPSKKLRTLFNTVYAVNVFEHIEDDSQAFAHSHKLLKQNGRIVVLVPAKKKAFTRLDKNLGHFRRYEKSELRDKLITAGFRIEDLFYFNMVGLMSWVIRDKIERQHMQLSSSHIAVFDKLVPFLRVVESRIRPPIGISLIAVGKKRTS